MARHRSYRLRCPIARALDRTGDRWALLILRDLHAGPVRFKDLHAGLPGLASNLLTTRLEQLQDDGLIVRRVAEHGAMVYELTKDGVRTAPVLSELAALGARWPGSADVRRPGNLRGLAVTLREALRRAVDDETSVHVELVVDAERFSVRVVDGTVTVHYGADPGAPIALATNYEAFIAVGDGVMTLSEFSEWQLRIERGCPRVARAFLALLDRALAG